MEQRSFEQTPLRDNFLRLVSDYSTCIKPYLRNIQDKYVTAYYIVEGEKVDVTAYCKNELNAALSAKKQLEGGSQE